MHTVPKKEEKSYSPENGSRISTIKWILEHYNIVLIINTWISIHDVSLKCLENPIRNYSVTGQIWYSCLGGSSRFMWVKLKSSSQMRMKIKKPCKKVPPKKTGGPWWLIQIMLFQCTAKDCRTKNPHWWDHAQCWWFLPTLTDPMSDLRVVFHVATDHCISHQMHKGHAGSHRA